mmetsp:Transcript_30063/g.71548  ORF Transcript_30063/g.71548 Transcript_30063/m.71548 type:complete len:295 (-) Transcript_30063:10-894(-)
MVNPSKDDGYNGWQKPIGLTKEHAIEVYDSDDGESCVTVTGVSLLPKSSIANDMAGSQSSNSKTNESSHKEDISSSCPKAGEDLKLVDQDVDINPFSSFAFSSDESLSWRDRKRPAATNSCAQKSSERPKKAMRNTKAKPCPLLKGTKEEKREQRKILIAKWHSFASPTAPTEERRFQVLLAARLHARVQEPIVYKAMDRLRRHFADKGENLTCTTLARCEVEEIAPLFSSVLFGNTKAKHIIQASKDLMRFGGRVPETMIGLQSITGIGPQLSEILYTVNRRSSYDDITQNVN